MAIELLSASTASGGELIATVRHQRGWPLRRAVAGGRAADGLGVYELVFHVGDYLRAGEFERAGAHLLDIVPLRFGIAATDQHYHVPLLISPFAYSTYRGS